MPKKPGAYHRPKDLTEALQLLDQPDSVVLAGGTKLLASESGLSAAHVVDLQALGLNQVRTRNGVLAIGATATLTDLAAYLDTQHPSEAEGELLRTVVHREGPNTYRNAATIGGTVASRLPDSELLAALLALEATVVFTDRSGSAEMSLADYMEADERPSGLISGVRVPWGNGRAATERVARTPADYPIVAVAGWQPEGETPRLAATGLDVRPLRLTAAEIAVNGELSVENIAAASEAARHASRHPGDFRGDAGYRAEMAAVLTRRVLDQLAQAD